MNGTPKPIAKTERFSDFYFCNRISEKHILQQRKGFQGGDWKGVKGGGKFVGEIRTNLS